MRFYELERFAPWASQSYVLKGDEGLLGRMLSLGATSFWGEYNPAKKGAEHTPCMAPLWQKPLPCLGRQSHLLLGNITSV